MSNLILEIIIIIIVIIFTDKIMYKIIRKVDKKERKKIDKDELNVYNELLEMAREIDKLKKENKELEKALDDKINNTISDISN